MSPLVVEGRCIVHVGDGTNGAVIAFDLGTGIPVWKWDGDAPGNGSPVPMTSGGRKQLVSLTARRLVGLDPNDGKLLWHVPFEATQGNNTTPVIAGSRVVFTGQGKGFSAVSIERQGEGFAATPSWTNPQFGARFTTPILKDGLLYGYSGRLFCARSETGTVLWDEAAELGPSAALVDIGSTLFALCSRGELLVFKPGAAFVPLARLKVADSETWAHPVVTGNRIVITHRHG